MDGLGLLVLLALIAVYLWLRREDQRTWVTIDDAHGRGLESLYWRLAYLQARGVRCRIKATYATGHQPPGQTGVSLPFAPRAILQVQREDSELARTLWLESGCREQENSPGE